MCVNNIKNGLKGLSADFNSSEMQENLQSTNNLLGVVNGAVSLYFTIQMIKANKAQQKAMEEANKNA